MKFLKGLHDIVYKLKHKKFWLFLWKFRDLDPKVTPGVGMVLIKTLYLYLPSGQIWMKSIKESSKYEVL